MNVGETVAVEVGWTVGVGVAEVVVIGVRSAVGEDVVGRVVVVVGAGEVGDAVPVVVGIAVVGFVVRSGVTFCGVTEGRGVRTGVTCNADCNLVIPWIGLYLILLQDFIIASLVC